MVDYSKRIEEKLFYWRSKIRIRDTHSPEEAVFCAIRDFADWYYQKYRGQGETDLDFVEDSNIIARTLEVLHNYVDQKRFAIPDV
jgi:glutamate synthase domain-containing protein 2